MQTLHLIPMNNVIDIDTRRSNRQIMDIEVRLEIQNKKKVAKIKPLPHGRLWQPGDEPGDLGFPEGPEYD